MDRPVPTPTTARLWSIIDQASSYVSTVSETTVAAVRAAVGGGADLHVTNEYSDTMLHIAARKGLHEICHVLLDAGSQIDARTSFQTTPLHDAARHGHADLCRTLVAHGADLDARNVRHETPLHLAADRGHVAACRVLLEAGAPIDAQDHEGWTPLHWPTFHRGQDDLCHLLLAHGADPLAQQFATGTHADPGLAHTQTLLADPTTTSDIRHRFTAHALRHLADQPAQAARLLTLIADQDLVTTTGRASRRSQPQAG
jgi:ankyrin repeat protein